MDVSVKSDGAVVGRLNITATMLDGILTVKDHGRANAERQKCRSCDMLISYYTKSSYIL